jgi:hypothetical protein
MTTAQNWQIWKVCPDKSLQLWGTYSHWVKANGALQLMRLLSPRDLFVLRYMGASVIE